MRTYYNVGQKNKTTLRGPVGTAGETLEAKLRRIKRTGEGIGAESIPIFTERRDGVLAQTNIRNDKFENMIEAHDKVTETRRTMREKKAQKEIEEKNPPKEGKVDGKSESSQGTE